MSHLSEATTYLVIAFSIIFSPGFVIASGWNYVHEDQWPIDCKEGTKQSPIALSRDSATEQEYSSLIFEQYDETYPAQSKNNGHSLEIKLHVHNQPTVKGGGLPHVYLLDNLHFHWESEHVMDDERFPLELHLVHYASRYANLSQALKYSGGVTVFAVLFYLSPDNDEQFEPLIDIIDKVKDTVNMIQEMHVKINDYLPRDKAGFYRYNGSLTTPDCTEGIIWTVFMNKIPISKAQVDAFLSLRADSSPELTKIVRNYRTLQELNDRTVYVRSSPIYSSAASFNMDSRSVAFALVFLNFYMLL